MRCLLPSAALLVLLAPAAWAAEATAEGAAALEQTFRSYLGPAPRVVSVRPEGESYALTVELGPLVQLLQIEGLKAAISPLAYRLTELDDGTWEVTEDQAFSAIFEFDGAATFKIDIARIASDGIWDPALGCFARQGIAITQMSTATEFVGFDGAVLSTDRTGYASAQTSATCSAGAAGGADLEMVAEAQGLHRGFAFPAELGFPGSVEMNAEADVTRISVGGLRANEILDLVAWFVAHPSVEAILAGQAEWKPLARAALPIFEALSVDYELRGIAVATPFGNGGAARFGAEVSLAGVVAGGRFSEAVTVEGLELPVAALPGWAVPLLPSAASIGVAVEGYDLAAPAAILLDRVNLAARDPFEDRMLGFALMGAVMPEGAVTITLQPGHVEGAEYRFGYEGAMRAGMMEEPTATGLVTLRGYDRLLELVNAAPPEVAELSLTMGLFRSLAREGAGGVLEWAVEILGLSSLTINGVETLGPPDFR